VEQYKRKEIQSGKRLLFHRMTQITQWDKHEAIIRRKKQV